MIEFCQQLEVIILITRLPEVKVKNTYRLHKRSLGEFDITAYNSHESVSYLKV